MTLYRASVGFSGLHWNVNAQRYYFPKGKGKAGQFLSATSVRDAIENDIDAQTDKGAKLLEELQKQAKAFQKGKISNDDWSAAVAAYRDGMLDQVKATHLNYAGAAHGGWAQLDDDAYDRVQETLKFHAGRLDNWASQALADPGYVLGDTGMDPEARNAMYFDTALFTFEDERLHAHVKAGYDEYRNVPHSDESCENHGGKTGCEEVTAMGWQKVGTLVMIGKRTCGPGCLCAWEFRRSSEVKH